MLLLPRYSRLYKRRFAAALALPPLDEDDATAGGDTLLEELGGADNLGADENIVEVWVKEAALDENGEFGNPGAPTFVVIDFFNFESEARRCSRAAVGSEGQSYQL